MKIIKNLGLVIFITGLAIWTASIFMGDFTLQQEQLDSFISEKGTRSSKNLR